MRLLRLRDVLAIHARAIAETGGGAGLRDLGGLESALAQPRMAFGGEDVYPTLIDKAAALGFSLIMNHPFVDGNKRVGYACMEAFLTLNGHEINADVDDAEAMTLGIAAGERTREELVAWLQAHTVPLDGGAT